VETISHVQQAIHCTLEIFDEWNMVESGKNFLLCERMSQPLLFPYRWCQPVCLWQVNSEALVHCLRGKSEEEILAINKVRLIVWVWGKGEYIGFEESVLTTLK
jgi:hypothetical protein